MARRKNLQPYKNELPASSGRRVSAYCIDAVLLIAVSFLLMLISFGILNNASFYKEKENKVNEEMIACYEIEESAKIYEFVDNEDHKYQTPRDQELTFKDYCYKHILYSYQMDPEPFKENDLLDYINKIEVPCANYENDYLANFYVNYVANNNTYNGKENDIVDFKGKSPKEYFYKVYKDNATNIEMWVFDDVNYSLPYLKSSEAIKLLKRIEEKYDAGVQIYNYLRVNYERVWNIEVDELINSSRFQEHFQLYKTNYASCSYIVSGATVISYVLAFIITILVPQFIFKNLQTVGKRLTKLQVVDIEGYEATNKQFIIRNLLNFLVYFGLMIITCFFSGGLNTGWMYPLFEIFGVGFSMFSIMAITAIVAFISFIVMVVSKNKTSLEDKIAGTYCIDLRYYNENKPDNEEREEKVVEKKEDKTYFDSSSFDNHERKDLTKK